MSQEDFKNLFLNAINIAMKNAEKQLGRQISQNVRISLHGLGHQGDTVDFDKAVEVLYLGEDKFYRIIDVAVYEITDEYSRIFIRVSGHNPVSFEQTWNTPIGSGPFKQIIAQIQEK